LTTENFQPYCRTIYSILGLRLTPQGDVKEIVEREEEVNLTSFKAIIVDEASMINAALWKYIKNASRRQGVKFIFLGDPAQLPPVGEVRSPVWELPVDVTLSAVIRHDNQILTLVTGIRKLVNHIAPTFHPRSDNDGTEGIWALTRAEFSRQISGAYEDLSAPNNKAKVVAWRNVTVEGYNKIIRNRLFPGTTLTWLPEDRIVLTEPVRDLDTGKIVAQTDDEGTILRVEVDVHPDYADITCWVLLIKLDDGPIIRLFILHETAKTAYDGRIAKLKHMAMLRRSAWADFWEFVGKFHKAKHAYAITAHRSQGSTYDTVYVDWRDIWLNHNRSEAMRCLYVALTRPRKRLFLG
jgi:exodeoxyribonuclease-5